MLQSAYYPYTYYFYNVLDTNYYYGLNYGHFNFIYPDSDILYLASAAITNTAQVM